jgi:hypothetical protein
MTGKAPMDETSPSTPSDDNECVSHVELKDMMRVMTDAFNKYQTTKTATFQRIHTSVDGLAARLNAVEAHFPHHAPPPIIPAAGGLAHNDTEDEFDDDEVDAQQRCRLLHHRQGMGGNGRRRPHAPEQDNDPYAKTKFSIPPFYGSYDAETYLDWEMMIEQKFSSHLVLEHHRVRQATSEFKDFAIIWWNELVNARNAPQTWTALKEEMCARFVPPSYRCDLRKKLQRFDQGDMSVQEYYQELQKGMLHCGVVEDQEDHIVRFYGGLRREIQDIVDYKEYHSIQHLFQLAMLVEKELQGHQQQRRNNTFTPRQLPVPAKAAPSSSLRAATPPSTGVVCSTAPSTSKGKDSSKSQTPPGVATKAMVSNTSTGRTSDIKCHSC